MTPLQQKILNIVWATGGFAFGGTSRDILRGEQPNDLDIRLGPNCDVAPIAALGACVVEDRAATQGEAYYDKAIVFESGEKVHVKYGYCEVTDCDINLVRMWQKHLDLLYVPKFLKAAQNPLQVVLSHILRKEFVPLVECPDFRQYRWMEFEKRGWKRLASISDLNS